MSPFVLDNSVTIAWCFPEETTPRTESLLNRASAGETMHVPALWPYEVANVLTLAVRKNRLSEEKADIFVQDLQGFNIRLDIQSRTVIFKDIRQLSSRYRLTAYDASYLELAMRLNLPLATLDTELIRAAKDTGVTLL